MIITFKSSIPLQLSFKQNQLYIIELLAFDIPQAPCFVVNAFKVYLIFKFHYNEGPLHAQL